MKFFRKTTMNSHIIMGRRTFESLPPNLSGRKYVVLSNSLSSVPDDVLLFCDIEEVKKIVRNLGETAFVIGGGEIYKQFLDCVNIMYLTEIQAAFPEVDTYFPYFDKSLWVSHRSEDLEENGLKYNHVMYMRKQKRSI